MAWANVKEEIFQSSESLQQLAVDNSEPLGNELLCYKWCICGFLYLKNLLKNIILKWDNLQQSEVCLFFTE